jgi:hypothetical protein
VEGEAFIAELPLHSELAWRPESKADLLDFLPLSAPVWREWTEQRGAGGWELTSSPTAGAATIEGWRAA